MDIRPLLKSQYHAALGMLKEAITICPKELWDAGDAPLWRVAYHTLFFTHFYLSPDEKSFKPWRLHVRGMHAVSKPLPKGARRQTRAQLLSYWKFCDKFVDKAINAMDLDAPQCGFPWYPMGKLEHQFVNIRHIQHHMAVLSARIRAATGKGVDWIGSGRKA